ESEPPLVKRAPGDNAGYAMREHPAQLNDIFEARNPARGDDGDSRRAPVARNVRQDPCCDTPAAEPFERLVDAERARLAPSADRQPPIAYVERAEDARREFAAGVVEQLPIEDCGRADGDVVGAGGKRFAHRLDRAKT